MSEGVYTLLPGTVTSQTVGHGREVGVLDLTGDGKAELFVTEAPENTEAPWDGVTDLFPPLLAMRYDPVAGLKAIRFTDHDGKPVRLGAANDLLIADFLGTGRPGFIAVSTGPEVLIPKSTPGSLDYVLDQLKLVTPNGSGGATVSIVSAGYPNKAYAAAFPGSGFGFWHSAVAGDFNGDGSLDVIAVNLQAGLGSDLDYSNRTATFLGDGKGQFTYAKDFLPQSFYQVPHAGAYGSSPPSVMAADDLNGDGLPDIAWGTMAFNGAGDPLYPVIARENRIYFNTGTGFSDDAKTVLPLPAVADFAALGVDINKIYADRVRIADLDNDGLKDVILTLAVTSVGGAANDPTFAQVWLQNADHTFRETSIWTHNALPARSSVVDAVDVNGDNQLDLVSNTGFLPSLKDAASNVWINLGNGKFQSLATLAPDVIAASGAVTSWWFANLDGTGPAELVVAIPSKAFTASSLAAYSLKVAAIQSIAGKVTTGTIFADRITGTTSADTINGGLGHDRIASGNGADMVNGGAGNDVIGGGAGDDRLTGGLGNDTLDGGAGADRMDGGSGNDTYVIDNAGDTVVEAASRGTDTIRAAISTALAANVENLGLLGSAAINGAGNDLANKITGNSGANVLSGGGGADTINGGAGSDALSGGLGKDRLTGGSGQDTFIFDTAPAAASFDIILDFSPAAGDRIQLGKASFAAFGYTGTLHADDFHAAAGAVTAHDVTDRLIYNTATGALYYDPDGVGGATAVKIALIGLSGHPMLAFTDFQIIA